MQAFSYLRNYQNSRIVNRRRARRFVWNKGGARAIRRRSNYRHNPYGRYGSTTPYSLQSSSRARSLTYHGPAHVPDRYNTNFRFGYVDADTTAGGIIEFIFRGNSLYDPDASVGGTAASGYDRFIYLYNKFRSDACAIHVTCLNIDADDPVYCSVFPSINGGTECVTLHECQDSLLWPHAKHAVVTLQGGEAGVASYATAKQLVAREVVDRDLAHDVSSNPSLPWFWHVVFFNHSGNALNLQYSLGLKYWTECYQPRLQYYHQTTW